MSTKEPQRETLIACAIALRRVIFKGQSVGGMDVCPGHVPLLTLNPFVNSVHGLDATTPSLGSSSGRATSPRCGEAGTPRSRHDPARNCAEDAGPPSPSQQPIPPPEMGTLPLDHAGWRLPRPGVDRPCVGFLVFHAAPFDGSVAPVCQPARVPAPYVSHP
jgi:hypothetical protein